MKQKYQDNKEEERLHSELTRNQQKIKDLNQELSSASSESDISRLKEEITYLETFVDGIKKKLFNIARERADRTK